MGLDVDEDVGFADRFAMIKEYFAGEGGETSEYRMVTDDLTNPELVNNIYLNLFGREADEEGRDFWVEALDEGRSTLISIVQDIIDGVEEGTRDDVVLQYRLQVANHFSDNLGDKTYGRDDIPAVRDNILYLVTDEEETVVAATAAADQWIADADDDDDDDDDDNDVPDPPVEGQVFWLTEGADRGEEFVGTEYDDLFIGDVLQNPLGQQVNSLGTGDRLDGNGGSNTLEAQVTEGAYVGGGNMPVQARTTNIQEVKLEAMNAALPGNSPVFVNAKHMWGIEELWSWESNADLIIKDLTTLASNGTTKRGLEEMTIGMGYTGNDDSLWAASDFKVYFDQNYILPTIDPGEDQVFYQIMNMDSRDQGLDPLIGVNVARFEFSFGKDGDLNRYDLAEYLGDDDDKGEDITTYNQLLSRLETALEDLIADGNEGLGLDRLDISLGTTFTTRHPDTQNQMTGTNVVLTAPGDYDLRAQEDWAVINPAREADIRNSARYERTDDEPGDEYQEIAIDVDLEKAGRGGDGGELVIGSMAKGTDANDWQIDYMGNGIDIFNVTVFGGADKPSSLAGLRSTKNNLSEVNIKSDPDQEESFASLEIGNSNPFTGQFPLQDVRILDATGMRGDLSIEAGLTNDIFGKYGGNLNFDYKLGQADNTLDMDMGGTWVPVNMNIESYGGDDAIDVTINREGSASHNYSLDIDTGSGDDTVTVNYAGWITISKFLNHVDLMNVSVDTGSGDDVVVSNDPFSAIIVDAGADNDYIEVGNTDQTAEWLFNAQLTPGSGPIGQGNQNHQFFNTKIVLEFQGIQVVQEIDTATGYTTTSREINDAIKAAIDGNWELSQLLTYEDVRNEGLWVSSTIDRDSDLDVSFLAPKYQEEIAGGNNWTTGNYSGDSATLFAERLTVTDSDLRSAWAEWYTDSEGIGQGSGTGIYSGVGAGNESGVFQAMFDNLDGWTDLGPGFGGVDYSDAQQILAGISSGTITMNVINAGSGNDVVTLSSNPFGAFDTVVFEGGFGHNVLYNFNTGANIGVMDQLDFTGYLDPDAAARAASATDASNARTTHQVNFTFNDGYNSPLSAFDHNQVVHLELSTLWGQLVAAGQASSLPESMDELSASQVARAMNQMYGGTGNVANATNANADMVGSKIALLVTQDQVINLQSESAASLGAAIADPNLTKVFEVTISGYNATTNQYSYSVETGGLIEFADMYSDLSDLTAGNIFGTAAAAQAASDALAEIASWIGVDPDDPIEPDPAYFEIFEVVYDDEVNLGDTFTVTVTIANSGDEEATQDVVFTMGEDELTEDITLDGGETGEVTFEYDTDGLDADEYSFKIATDDDDYEGNLTVAEEDGDDDNDDDNDDDDDDDIDDDITIEVGETGTITGPEGEEAVFTFDIAAALESPLMTQPTIENFDTDLHSLALTLPEDVDVEADDLGALIDAVDGWDWTYFGFDVDQGTAEFGLNAADNPDTVALNFLGIADPADIDIAIAA